ncbi:MAG: SIS domain-containing protein [Thermoplasmata archaeon]|nr:MAG: SIS domain-containing protein [Thermoplasmata archaeon]
MSFTQSVKYITNTLQEVLSNNDSAQIDEVIDYILKAKKVFVYGVGRSGHVGKGFAMRLVQLGLKAYFIGETITPIVEAEDAAVIISNTGETMSAIQTGNIVRRVGAKVVVVTSNNKSKLAHCANIVVCIPIDDETRETGLAPLGTLFEDASMIFLDGVISVLMAKLGETEESMRGRHAIMV